MRLPNVEFLLYVKKTTVFKRYLWNGHSTWKDFFDFGYKKILSEFKMCTFGYCFLVFGRYLCNGHHFSILCLHVSSLQIIHFWVIFGQNLPELHTLYICNTSRTTKAVCGRNVQNEQNAEKCREWRQHISLQIRYNWRGSQLMMHIMHRLLQKRMSWSFRYWINIVCRQVTGHGSPASCAN